VADSVRHGAARPPGLLRVPPFPSRAPDRARRRAPPRPRLPARRCAGIEEVAASGDPDLAGELDGLAAIVESHFAFEERRIHEALDALDALDGSAVDLLGAQENSAL
jgi:hypothetical protein